MDDLAFGFRLFPARPAEEVSEVSVDTGPTILIVHADPLIGLMLEELLREGNVSRVITVTTENQAAPFVATGKIDAAILGIRRNNLELLAVAGLLTDRQIPFMISGALTSLPDVAGLGQAPVLHALASSSELLATLSRLGASPQRSEFCEDNCVRISTESLLGPSSEISKVRQAAWNRAPS